MQAAFKVDGAIGVLRLLDLVVHLLLLRVAEDLLRVLLALHRLPYPRELLVLLGWLEAARHQDSVWGFFLTISLLFR